jgi:hypothetical protein
VLIGEREIRVELDGSHHTEKLGIARYCKDFQSCGRLKCLRDCPTRYTLHAIPGSAIDALKDGAGKG